MTGNLEIWVSSIVYTIGTLNFLFDKSFEPYIPSSDIHDYFGTKGSTVSAKSKLIRDLLNLNRFNNEFSTSCIVESNPFNQFVMVDDMIVPLDSIPEEFVINCRIWQKFIIIIIMDKALLSVELCIFAFLDHPYYRNSNDPNNMFYL